MRVRTRRWIVATVGLGALSLAAGCGSANRNGNVGAAGTPAETTSQSPTFDPSAMPTTTPPAPGLVTTVTPVTVLAKGDEPAEACVGGVLTSLPPQCGGPVLDGFDWADHVGEFDEVKGIRWGEFVVTGHFDGHRIAVTEIVPAKGYKSPEASEDPDPFTTPCPVPPGGWKVLDPSKADEDVLDHVWPRARRLPGYADGWLDYAGSLTIVNVRVTHDVGAAEAALREVWGGPLCVSHADRDRAEIRRIGRSLGGLPGVLEYGGDNEPIEARVIWDDGSLQAWADATYGRGVVTISSALAPASG